MVEERRAAKEAAAAGEREFWAEQRERERQMDSVVEEERLKLLKSHAARLVGHLGRIYGSPFLSDYFHFCATLGQFNQVGGHREAKKVLQNRKLARLNSSSPNP